MFSSYLLKGAETMKKLSLTLLLCSNFLFADYLYQPSNICIKEYWYTNGSFYYIRSDNGLTVSTTTKNLGDDVFRGYDYNASINECTPETSNNTLGLSNEDFNYLNAFLGLVIFGLLMVGLFL